MVLSADVNSWLDHQRLRMRSTTGTCMSRSELLRAMVRAAAEFEGVAKPAGSCLFERCKTEEDIACELFCGGLDEHAQPAANQEATKC